jgi:hypothetical protein
MRFPAGPAIDPKRATGPLDQPVLERFADRSHSPLISLRRQSRRANTTQLSEKCCETATFGPTI